MAVRIIKHAMEIIHLLTDLNPIQVVVDAIINRLQDLTTVLFWASLFVGLDNFNYFLFDLLKKMLGIAS